MRMDMLEVYKIVNSIYDTKSAPKLLIKEDDRTRGNGKSLVVQRAKTELRRNSFTCRVAPMWNSLPRHVVEAPSKDSFKARLDSHWRPQKVLYDHKTTLTRIMVKGVTHPSTEE